MKAIFKNKVHQGSDIHTFHFGVEDVPEFAAGQFTHIRLYHSSPDDRGEKRYFTISSSPTEEDFCITTRLVEKRSSFKQSLSDLKPGSTVHFEHPDGDFTLPSDMSKKLVLVAGGIGITPYRSQAKYLVDKGEKREIELIYAVRAQEDMVFLDLFEQAGYEVKPLVSEHLPDTKKLIELMGDTSDKIIYLSGPEQFVEKLEYDLKNEGIDKQQIKTDFFPGYEANLT